MTEQILSYPSITRTDLSKDFILRVKSSGKGLLHNRSWYTYRTVEHLFRKYDALFISVEILRELKASNVKSVVFLYQKLNGEIDEFWVRVESLERG